MIQTHGYIKGGEVSSQPMLKKILLIITITAMIIAVIVIYNQKNSNYKTDEVIYGIENFNEIKKKKTDSYLLIYPADNRVSQNNTIVKEVSKKGEIIYQYEIVDDFFRRSFLHQKPNNNNILYMSSYGEAKIENWYYTYDITNKNFKRVSIPYFEFDTGVNHIQHYGEDIVFETIVSHLTGDQNYNENKGFKVSISNFSKQKSFETDYGYSPNWSRLIEQNNKIFYSTNAPFDNQSVLSYIAVLNEYTSNINYVNFHNDNEILEVAYLSNNQIYIIGGLGNLYVLNEDLSYDEYRIFDDCFDIINTGFTYFNSRSALMLNENTAIHEIYNIDLNEYILGTITFSETPSFTPLNFDYINRNYQHRVLYNDNINNIIYIIESNNYDVDDAYLIVLNNQTLELIDKIPVDYSNLIDMVVF